MTPHLPRPAGPRAALNAVWLRLAIAQQNRLLPWVAIAAIAGAATYLYVGAEPPVWLAPGCAALGATLLPWRRALLPHVVALLLLAFAAGLFAARQKAHAMPAFAPVPYRASMVRGTVIARDMLVDGVRLTLGRASLDGSAFGPRSIRVTWRGPVPDISVGAIVSVRARLFPPDPPAIPGGRDPEREAWFSGLGASGYALAAPTVLRHVPASRLQQARDDIAARLMRDLPGAPGAVAATLLTGESAAVPEPDRAAFRAAGLSHLLAIAGLHIGIVMGLATLAARFLLLRSEYLALRIEATRAAALVGLVAGGGYFLLTGGHVPTGRSLLMAALVVLGLLAGRRAFSLRGWGLAALAVVALAPSAVAGPSFQLSFAAVLALIAGYEVAAPWLRRVRGQGGWRRATLHHLIALALTSLLAGSASLPFIAYHFGAIQPYFILANLVAVPLTAFWVMPLGLLSLPLMPFGLEGPPVRLMGAGISVILRLAHAIAGLPAATLPAPDMPGSALVLAAAALGLLCLNRGRWRALAVPPALAACLIWACATPPDLLIAANGRAYGLRAGHRLHIVALRGGDPYTVAVWQQHFGALPLAPAQCPATRCAVLGGQGAWHFGQPPLPCAATLLILRASPHPGCPGTPIITHTDLRRNGAYAIWLAPHPRARTDRQSTGNRPWTAPALPGLRPIGLKLAPTEALPPGPD